MTETDITGVFERIIHNGTIIDEIPGVKTEALPAWAKSLPINREVPQSIEDIEPEVLARLMAGVINVAVNETPQPSPMEIVNRLLQLKTERGHKVVWTRFDIQQLFALWTNKIERNRTGRGSNA